MHIYASHHLISTHVFVCIQNPGAPISSSTIPSATTILPHPTSFTSSVTSYAPVNDTPITTTTITVAATSTIAATSDERLASTTTNRILQSTVVPVSTTAVPSSSPYKATNSNTTTYSNNTNTPTKPPLPPTTLASPTVSVSTSVNATTINTSVKQSSSSQRLPQPPSSVAATPYNTTPSKQPLSNTNNTATNNIQPATNNTNGNGVMNMTEQVSLLSAQSVGQGHGALVHTKVGGSIPVSSTSKISDNAISSSNNNNSNSRVNPYLTSPNPLPPKLNATSSSVTLATSLAPTASPDLHQSSSPATSEAAAVTHEQLSDELRSLRYDIHKELQVILREQNRLMELNKVSISRLVAMFRLGLGH